MKSDQVPSPRLGPGSSPSSFDDGGSADLGDAELLEFTQDSGVTPSVFASEFEDQVANFLIGLGPTDFGIVGYVPGRFFLVSAEPAKEGAWGNDSDEMMDGFAEALAELEKPVAILGSELDSLGKFAP